MGRLDALHFIRARHITVLRSDAAMRASIVAEQCVQRCPRMAESGAEKARRGGEARQGDILRARARTPREINVDVIACGRSEHNQ